MNAEKWEGVGITNPNHLLQENMQGFAWVGCFIGYVMLWGVIGYELT